MNRKISSLSSVTIWIAYYLFSVVLIAGYVFIYQSAPFEGILNDTVLNILIALASLLAAVVSTANFRHYQPEDQPRTMWRYIMLASWSWFLSEVVWDVLYFKVVEVPTPNVADIGWIAGYVFFAVAIYYQYVLILPSMQNRIRNIIYGVLSLVVAMPFLALSIMGDFTLENYINYFYPFFDLSIVVAGVIVIYFFQGGMLMRPWLGMIVFAVADFLYAWAIQTGIYSWSVDTGNSLTLIADSSYLFAYLILALGFISHWILIKFGLRGD